MEEVRLDPFQSWAILKAWFMATGIGREMSKEYRYPRHVYWMQSYVVPIFTGFIILCIWASVGLIHVITGKELFDLALDGISISAIFLLEGLVLWYIFYRLTGVRVSISDGAIIYRNRNGETRILPNEITKIQFPSIRYTGGWIKIVSGSKVIRLTVVIEKIGELIKELKALLDESGNSHRYDQGKMFKFLKTATYSDQSWARLYSAFWPLVAATNALGLAGIIVGIFGNIGMVGVVLWMLISPLWPVAVYLIVEIIYARKVAKESRMDLFSCPERDSAYERSVLTRASFAGLILYLAGSLLIVGPRFFP